MSEQWESKPFADVIGADALFCDGDWIESKDQNPNGKVRLVQLADILDGEFKQKSERFMTHEKSNELRTTLLKEGDLLIARMPDPIGRSCIFPGSDHDCVTVVDVAIARPTRCDPKWLMYQLNSQSVRAVIEERATGSTRKRISRSALSEIILQVPPLPEQKKIAEILSGIDRELDTCRENLYRTNLLRTSLLKSMMHGAEEDSIEQMLGSIVEVVNGRAYKLTEWESEGTPVIRLQNLTKQGGNFYYSNLQLPEKQYCEKGDLLFMWSASFGPHKWWGERAIYHYHIWKMVPKDNSLLKDYLYLYLQHKTEEWKSQGAGMAMIHLTKEGIEKETIPLPPVATQERIVNAIKSIDERIEAEKSKANKISLLKVAISSDLLSGRKRVSV